MKQFFIILTFFTFLQSCNYQSYEKSFIDFNSTCKGKIDSVTYFNPNFKEELPIRIKYYKTNVSIENDLKTNLLECKLESNSDSIEVMVHSYFDENLPIDYKIKYKGINVERRLKRTLSNI